MDNNTELTSELLSQLESELTEAWEQLKQIKEGVKGGTVGLEEFISVKMELETRIDDLTRRIYYINKAKSKVPEKEERITHEAELIMNEYPTELIDNSIYQMQVFLTVSVHRTWVVEINFSNPKVPLFKIPSELPKMIGNIYETVDSLRTWTGHPNEHLVDIIREIEQKLLDLELVKSLPELELERGRVMDQAKKLVSKGELDKAVVFYNHAADISERIGDQAIAVVCRLKAQKLIEELTK